MKRKDLTPYEALQAITSWSAYQHFEEDQKGTLEEGKLADMVILEKNPLKSICYQLKLREIVRFWKPSKKE